MIEPCLESWLETPQGQYLLAWEQEKFDLLVSDIFGFSALQVGLAGHDFLRSSRIASRFVCAEEDLQGRAHLLCQPFELPFASQSLDLVVLPHVLEFSEHPHQLLREIDRVLVPEGCVLIAGFNPLSLWGVRRKLAGNRGEEPWTGQFLSVPRLKDWLALLGFEMRMGAFGCYAPPVCSQKWLEHWAFMDKAGDRWWPFMGGTYMIQAVKKVAGMRLVQPQWKKAGKKRKNMIPATLHKDER